MQQPLLPGVDRKQIVQIVTIVMAIGGVFALLGGAGAVFGGSMLAFAGGVSGLLTIGGILLLVEGVASLAIAYGLYTRKPWGRMGTVAIAALSVVAQIVWLLAGVGGIGSIVQAVFYGLIAYFFYTDAEVKTYLGGT